MIAVWSRRITRQLIVSGGLVLLPGCQESLPVGPSDLSNGIVVYEHANYLGESAHITQGIKDLKDFQFASHLAGERLSIAMTISKAID